MNGNKLLILIISLIVFTIIYIFFINKSYSLAYEAKIAYMQDDFNKSLSTSKLSLKIDKYNKMAVSIKTKSLISLSYIKYLKDANSYIKKINKFENTYKNMLKIKMISDIMVSDFEILDKSVDIPSSLKVKAIEANTYFVNILKGQ